MSEALSTNQAAEPPYPNRTYAWYVVILLLLAYIVAFLDRQIIGLLVEPIKRDLDLTDFQIGLLLGPAFAIFYVTLGIPIGMLVDRKSRKQIIGWGISIWCVMTAACGLAKNFGQLFGARIGVGVGEATLTPAALSMISDYFPPKPRARAVGVYMMGISLGSAISLLLGGPLVQMIAEAPPITLPWFGPLFDWQATFIIVGLPGLLVAVLMFLVREPARRGRAALAGSKPADEAGLMDGLMFLVRRWRAYGGLFLGMSVVTMMAYVWFWNAALFDRTWGWSVADFAVAYGLVLLVCGPLGAWLAGSLSTKLMDRNIKDGPYLSVLIGVLFLIPASVAFPLMPSGELALVFAGLATVFGALPTAAGAAALVYIAPNQVRGTATAIYWMVINLVALSLGPTSVGFFTDQIFKDESKLYLSMAVVPAIFGVICVGILIWGRKHYRAAVDESAAWQEADA